VIGPASGLPGVIFATGHYRNGVLLAPLTAALVKDLVLGEQRDPALAVLAPSRFDKPRES
jgi:glycine oxidase